MKVLHVITDDTRRGAQIFALDLHAAMFEHGADVFTVALASETSEGLTVTTLGPTRRHLKTGVALRRAARDADVVIAHGSTTLTMSILATAGTGVPVIYRQISDSLYWAPTRRRRRQVATLLRRTATIVALAEQSKQVLVAHFGLHPDHIRVIPNGAPAHRFPPPTPDQRNRARSRLRVEDRLCVAYVGALVPEKGVDVAIDAIARIPQATLVVAGDGPERAALEARSGAANADVRFIGSVDRPLDVLHASDVLVLPSKGGDSMPAVLIEAALTGLPVVATPIGAIPEVIEHGATGIIISTAEPDALVDALTGQLATGRSRTLMGQAARVHAIERFEIAVIARSWLDACADVTRSAV